MRAAVARGLVGFLGLVGAAVVVPAGSAAAVDPVERVHEVTEVGTGFWEIPQRATAITATLRGAAGEQCYYGVEEGRGGPGGVVTIELADSLAGSTLGYVVGGTATPEPADASRSPHAGGEGTALAIGDDLLAIVGGGGGAAIVLSDDDHCAAGGAGGVAMSPGVGAGDAGQATDLFDSRAPGGGGTAVGGVVDPEASYHGTGGYGGFPGVDGPPSVDLDGTITLSAGGLGAHTGGSGGSGYAGGAGGTADVAAQRPIIDEGAGGGGSGFLADDPRVSVVAGSAGVNTTSGSITFSYTMPGAPVAEGVHVDVGYGSEPTAIPAALEGEVDSVAIGSEPEWGQVEVDGLDLVYTPDPAHTGTDSFTYIATGPGGSSEPATVTVAVGAPMLTVGEVPEGIQGQPYRAVVTVAGGTGPHQVDFDGLPDGLSVDADGVLTGTPTEAGAFVVDVSISDSSVPEPATAHGELRLHVFSNQFTAPDQVMAGDEIELAAENFAPGSYDVVLRSEPVTLGQVTVGADAVLAAQVSVPAEATAGPYTLELVRDGVVIAARPLEVTVPAAPEPELPPETEPEVKAPEAELPETGTPTGSLAGLALLLGGGGAAVLSIRAVRSAR